MENVPRTIWSGVLTVITENEFPYFLQEIEKFDKLAIDTETTGLQLHTKDVVAGVAVYTGIGSYYVPIRHSMQTNINPGQYKQLLAVISKLKIFVNHHTKFDLHALSRDGCTFSGTVIDTQPGAHLLDENNTLKLKELAKRYLSDDSADEERKLYETLDRWGLNKGEMWRLPPEVAGPYAEKDTVLAWNLAEHIAQKLPEGLGALWVELNAFSELLRKMEKRGILVDVDRLNQRKKEALAEAQKISEKLRALIHRPINVNSSSQVARVFGLKNADEEALMSVKNAPGAMDVLKYRWLLKACNLYYNKYPDLMDASNVIHTHYNITGTETGRLSCSEPNMQQIPRWSEEYKIKDVFVAREGYTFVEADYSQAEIRVAAHYTKDPAVLDIFDSGLDYHTETAKKLGIARQKAKVINLALNYGAGVYTLVKQLGWSEKDVKKVLADYHKAFPGFRKTSKEAEKIAEDRGFIKYWTGRRRHFDSPYAESRTAFNSLVQGGTAEMVRSTMQRLDSELPSAIQLLQTHDSIFFEIKKEEVKETIPEIKRIMEHQPWCSVTMKVDIKEGDRWSQMKEYQP